MPEEWALTSLGLKGILLWEQTNVWGVGSYFLGVEGHLLWEQNAWGLGSYFSRVEGCFALGTNTWGGGGHSHRKSPCLGHLLQECLRSRTFLKKEPTPGVFTLGTPEEEVIPRVSGPKWPFNLSSIPKVSIALGLLRCSQSKCPLTPPWVGTYFRNASLAITLHI